MQIRDLRPQLRERRLRLIHSGRLLTDGVILESRLKSLEEAQTIAGVESHGQDKDKREVKGKGKGKAKGEFGNNTWLHCSVGPKMEDGRDEIEQVPVYIHLPLYLTR